MTSLTIWMMVLLAVLLTTKIQAQLEWEPWEGGVVPYVMSSEIDKWKEARIVEAMREIEKRVNTPNKAICVQFVPRTDEEDYIEFLGRGSCYSGVGDMSMGRQTVGIGRRCQSKGTIMHELTHTLGFEHEQLRPDRDEYIDIDWSNIREIYKYNYRKTGLTRMLNTSYDFGSIMHYGQKDYALDRSKPAFTPKVPVPASVTIGHRWSYSKMDILDVQRLYGCHEDTSRVSYPPLPCRFRPDSECSIENDNTDDFDWELYAGYGYAETLNNHDGEKARIMTTITTPDVREMCVEGQISMTTKRGSLIMKVTNEQGNVLKEKTFLARDYQATKSVQMTSPVPASSNVTLSFTAKPIGAASRVVLKNVNVKFEPCD